MFPNLLTFRLQDEIQETAMQLRSVEKEANDLKREKQELISDLEANKLEKKHLQKVLETTLEEKKRMTDKLNRFTIIGILYLKKELHCTIEVDASILKIFIFRNMCSLYRLFIHDIIAPWVHPVLLKLILSDAPCNNIAITKKQFFYFKWQSCIALFGHPE